MTTVAHPPPKGYRTIRVPLSAREYELFLPDRDDAKRRLQELSASHPALFPEAFAWSYMLYGFTAPYIRFNERL